MNENERKDFRYCLELKEAKLDENIISGAAAAIGNMDSYGDVIFPGAFSKAVLREFLQTGFVPDTHDWWSMARLVAMPKSAVERGRMLECTAKFHGTEYAQTVRQVCQERMAEGLSCGLSIGFSIDYGDDESRMWFESSGQMLKYIKDAGLDLALFDVPSIKAWGDRSCRAVFKVKRLFEFSPVPIPANPQANAMSVKQFASDLGSLIELSFDDHSETVLTAVRGLRDRLLDYKAKRDAQGRPLSDARCKEIDELKELLGSLLTSTEEAPAAKAAPLRDLRTQVLALDAALMPTGV
jgi:phage head maturation protease